MTAPVRILDTDLHPPRWNVAMTAALVERRASGHVPDTIRFHRYPACVLVGRGQDLHHVADVDFGQRNGLEFARRITGGGAVFMSPRMLAWDVVLKLQPTEGGFESVTRQICEAIAAGLSRLGATARFRTPNDIEIGNRKVSGSGGYAHGRAAVLQGTVLIEDDVSLMARALRIPEAALRNRVTSLAVELGHVPTLVEVREQVLRGVLSGLKRTPISAEPSDDEVALAETLLRDEIGTDNFVWGDHPRSTADGQAA